MDGTSGEGRLAGEPAYEPIDTGLVSRSRELTDVSFGAIVDAEPEPGDGSADETRIQWATPDGLEVVGRGVAARLVATGPDRFDEIRRQAARVFDGIDHDGPEIARPRAFGGFAFHDRYSGPNAETAASNETRRWQGFDAASFVIPRVLVTRSDTATSAAGAADESETSRRTPSAEPDADVDVDAGTGTGTGTEIGSGSGTWLTTVATDASAATTRLEHWDERIAALPAMQPSGTGPGVAGTRRTTSRLEWTTQVDRALERIADGRLTKVVLAQALSVDLEGPLDIAALLERLRRQYPNCYRFLIGPDGGGTFFGAPPERLVAKRGARVETEALAGSVPRGETPEADDEHAERMLGDDKFRREHRLVVEAIRDQLEPLARELSIDDRTVRKLATIQHLQTPIEATLDADRHVLDLVEALHPTPAVGGVPPDAAWDTIRETEAFDRGWYAAPVGWFDGDGDGEFAVGLRSGIATERAVTLFAGSGIVADSDPDEEWDEVQLKFRPILDELR